jgi:hypothetical protein
MPNALVYQLLSTHPQIDNQTIRTYDQAQKPIRRVLAMEGIPWMLKPI